MDPIFILNMDVTEANEETPVAVTIPILYAENTDNDNNLVCKICLQSFGEDGMLLEHIRTHKVDDPYLCNECGQDFKDLLSLMAHSSRKHTSGQTFECSICGHTFPDANSLQTHVSCHTGNPPYKSLVYVRTHCVVYVRSHNVQQTNVCLECGETFSQKAELLDHKEIHSIDDVSCCFLCKYVFSENEEITQHMGTHLTGSEKQIRNDEPEIKTETDEIYVDIAIEESACSVNESFLVSETASDVAMEELDVSDGKPCVAEVECSPNASEETISKPDTACEKTLSNKSNILIDSQVQISNKPPKCSDHVSKKDLSKKNLTPTRARRYNCHICGWPFPRVSALNAHILKHNNDTKETKCHPSGPTDTETYTCNTCNGAFKTRTNLRRHMRIHTKETPFTCLICGKTFSRKDTLDSHLLMHSGMKAYQCTTCGKSFAKMQWLRNHKTVHTGERPHKCTVCQKGYRLKVDLNKHFKTHSVLIVVKPYCCDSCGKTFKTLQELNTHYRTHTGEKPFECEFCHLKFSQKTSLTTHRRKHTGDKPYQCNSCGKSFAQHSALRLHAMTHTGQKRYNCALCGRAYSNTKSFKKHMLAHGVL